MKEMRPMRRTDAAGGKASRSVMDNNKFVFVLSLLIAVVCWVAVSMVNTQEVERRVSGVKVQLIQADEVLENYGLSIFDQTEFTVDVTLKGYSYLLRDITPDDIELTASCASVAAAGTYDLPVTSSLSGTVNPNVKITKLSSGSVKVYFDKEVSKTFTVTEDIVEKEGYAIAEGYERENPILSAESVTVSGASRDVSRIVAVRARAELNKTLNSTERLEAELILESDSGVLDITDFTVQPDGPFYITIPVNHTGTYDAVVDFANLPQDYKTSGFPYTVTPATVDVTSMTSVDTAQLRAHQISVGTVDFADIEPGKVNHIPLTFDSGSGAVEYEVEIDASDFVSRTLSIPVDTSNVTLPGNVRVTSAEVAEVTVAGPADSVEALERTSVYAVPATDGLSALAVGQHSVAARFVFRTATDCWVCGKYTVDVAVQ